MDGFERPSILSAGIDESSTKTTKADTQSQSVGESISRARCIHEAMREGARRALTIHHKLGQDVVTWRDGKIAIIPDAEVLAKIDALSQHETT